MQEFLPAGSARELAFQVLYNVTVKDAYANLALKEALSLCSLSIQDRAFATHLVYGTVRMKASLDYILGQLVERGIASLHNDVLLLLRIGLYQLVYMENVKEFAVVDETVKLVKKYHLGATGLCNAVLRNYLRKKDKIVYPDSVKFPAQYLEVKYSYPRFMTGYFIKRWGFEAAKQFCIFCNQTADICVCVNPLQGNVDSLRKELEAQGITVNASKYLPECLYLRGVGDLTGLTQFVEGKFIVMDEGSVMAAKALNPVKGSTVMDLCAAPGGKTVCLAMQMENKGSLYAFDIYEHKIELLKQNFLRMQLDCMEAVCKDARTLEEFNEKADYILLDTPCTGWGVLGRKADSRWKKSYEDIAELVSLSRELLLAAADYLKKGGVLVYSTCTVTQEENEKNIEWFLQQRNDFERESITSLLPYAKNEAEKAAITSGAWQILPHEQGLEGFFLCRMRKKN